MALNNAGRTVIRLATESDAATLAKLGAGTFAGAFEPLYRPEDLQSFLKANHAVAIYENALKHPDIVIWIVECDGLAKGYCQVGPNTLPCDPPLPDALELSRLYMLQDIQGRGFGTQLIETVFVHAKAAGYADIVLSVFSENPGGQRLYARHGFEKIGEYNFWVGNHIDREWIMRKRL